MKGYTATSCHPWQVAFRIQINSYSQFETFNAKFVLQSETKKALKNILLIEDDPTLSRNIKEALTEEQLQVDPVRRKEEI